MSDAARFVRQILLPEIGEAGQRRIAASSAAASGPGLAGDVASRYAEAAGFGAVVPGSIDVAALAPEALCASAPAREVLAGARAALAEIRRAIAASPHEMEGALDMVTSEPWTRGGVEITRAALAAVEADALDGYRRDEEACGYLRGPAGGVRCDEHVRMVNTANKLHALDPERYFRTAREFFSFNEKRFVDAVDASAREGRPVKVLVHSHLDAGAYFSPTDAAVMSMGEPPAAEGAAISMGPGPAWPLAFLVTSVRAGAVEGVWGGGSWGSGPSGTAAGDPQRSPPIVIAEHRLFVWDAAARDFVASSFTVVD